jgi:D-alanine-D-alanine ligase
MRFSMRIEIVTTSNEALKETGFGTLKACHNVLDSIRRLGYIVTLNVCETAKDLDEIAKRQPDLVVLAVKYISVDNGSDIWLSDYFANNGINFTGSSREVLKFDSDKVLAKSYLRKKGIKTADYFTAIPGQYTCGSELPVRFPLFLKPLDAANGNGIDDLSFVTNFSDYESKLLSLYNLFGLPVLVEEYLDGREFTVAVIDTMYSDLIVSAVEVVPPQSTNGLRILGEKAKRDDSEKLKKSKNSKIIDSVRKLAVDTFHYLGVRDFGRIDVKVDGSGQCYFMEANLVPGMTSGSSYFPKACEIENQISYDDMIGLILDEGLRRVPLVSSPGTNGSLTETLTAVPEPLAV